MIFTWLTLISALALAAVADWFSIIGLMAILAGQPIPALILGITFAIAKLVSTSWLYRNWKEAGWAIKAPLAYFTVTLMIVTSLGVFGFLSKAHLEQGASTIDNAAKVERIVAQIDREKSLMADNDKVIAQLDATVNSFIGKDRADRAVSVRRSQSAQRKQLKDDSDTIQKNINGYNDEKFKLESEVRKLELEVGPIRYIAQLFYGADNTDNKTLESAVRIFTLLIVSTLDPLAIILLIAANFSIIKRQNEQKETLPSPNPAYTDSKEEETPGIPSESTSSSGHPVSNVQNHAAVAEEHLEYAIADISEPESAEIHDTLSNEVIDNTLTHEEDTHIPATAVVVSEQVEGTGEVVQGAGEAASTLQDKVQINEEESAILEAIDLYRKSMPMPVIRQPALTRVSSEQNNTTGTTVLLPSVETPVHLQTEVTTPWAEQTNLLREIIGNMPHFIAAKVIDEEEKHQEDENKSLGTSTVSDTQQWSPLLQESADQEVPETNIELDKQAEERSTPDKYPKALSWLAEFKRI